MSNSGSSASVTNLKRMKLDHNILHYHFGKNICALVQQLAFSDLCSKRKIYPNLVLGDFFIIILYPVLHYFTVILSLLVAWETQKHQDAGRTYNFKKDNKQWNISHFSEVRGYSLSFNWRRINGWLCDFFQQLPASQLPFNTYFPFDEETVWNELLNN